MHLENVFPNFLIRLDALYCSYLHLFNMDYIFCVTYLFTFVK
jgi:hypothetical protein